MENWSLLFTVPFGALAKVAAWLAIFVLTLDTCPEALAVAREPPLIKCFPPGQQASILAHLTALVLASLLLFA